MAPFGYDFIEKVAGKFLDHWRIGIIVLVVLVGILSVGAWECASWVFSILN
ncbi:hypothetical protein KAR91_77375 [Candidatus Pacearchaeota archaeon]|nr:hypothetical protein [Candidatus Pacearchaeota archaeon]